MSEPPTVGQGAPDVTPEPVPSTATRATEPDTSPHLWARLKHHKVIEWTLAYAAAAYTLLHGAEMVSNALHWPELVVRVTLMVLVLGLPIAVLVAWYHGHKAQQRISGPELAILTVLLLMAGTILWVVSRNSSENVPASVAASTAKPANIPAAPRTAVAVLAFANLTGDASKDYLGEGMAEELINTLTKVQRLKVPARTSTFAYKGRNTDVRQIAKDLGVGTVLEGSVRVAGKRIRVTAQLINAQDGLHLWSETYDEDFTDIFKLQDKLATQIAKALQPSLGGTAEATVAQGPPTQDVEAYNRYLKGRELLTKPSESTLQQAIADFREAIARDPRFARAYAGMAEAYWQLSENWTVSGNADQNLAVAIRFARRALSIDPQLTSAHSALAMAAGKRLQLLEMEAHSRAALALGANDSLTHAQRTASLGNTGHVREQLAEALTAYSLAPANSLIVANLAYAQVMVGRDAEALKYADTAVAMGFPKGSPPLSQTFSLLASHAGRFAEAAALWVESWDSEARSSTSAEVVRLVYAARANPSRIEETLAARNRLFPRSVVHEPGRADEEASSCMEATLWYGSLGAGRALDVAYDLADQCMDELVPGQIIMLPLLWTPERRPFRRDPRFQPLATRLGLMEYWQQYGPPDGCDLNDGKLACH